MRSGRWVGTWQLACPLAETGTVPHPVIVVPPSVNATVPPSGVGETVAVRLTWPPVVEGFPEDASDVVVREAWYS